MRVRVLVLAIVLIRRGTRANARVRGGMRSYAPAQVSQPQGPLQMELARHHPAWTTLMGSTTAMVCLPSGQPSCDSSGRMREGHVAGYDCDGAGLCIISFAHVWESARGRPSDVCLRTCAPTRTHRASDGTLKLSDAECAACVLHRHRASCSWHLENRKLPAPTCRRHVDLSYAWIKMSK